VVLGKLLGFDDNSLAKLTIRYEKDEPGNWAGEIQALFNPSELQISRTVSWGPLGGSAVGEGTSIEQQFRAVRPRTTSLELFFDSYEDHATSGVLGFVPSLDPFPSPAATDVRVHTTALMALAEVDPHLHRPPKCRLEWGAFDNIFCGVVTSLSVSYSMFMPSGMPVRATVRCELSEDEEEGTELFSPDVDRRHTVAQGETLHAIAQRVYGDASRWKLIARANGISNPRTVRPGTIVTIPKLEPGR
jgi:nucleoid-associated protein YgaU